jgi:membrane fusion protein (multidrug efflux system)
LPHACPTQASPVYFPVNCPADRRRLFAHWFFKGRFYESTDNAYVQGEITRVSSQLGARIDKVLVQDNQHVEKDQLLIKLEGDDFHLAVDRANAALATREAERLQAQSKLTQQSSLIAASDAQVASTQPAWVAHRST